MCPTHLKQARFERHAVALITVVHAGYRTKVYPWEHPRKLCPATPVEGSCWCVYVDAFVFVCRRVCVCACVSVCLCVPVCMFLSAWPPLITRATGASLSQQLCRNNPSLYKHEHRHTHRNIYTNPRHNRRLFTNEHSNWRVANV